MAQITINIPDDKMQGVIDAFAFNYEYQEQIEDPSDPETLIPNPETKAQFAKSHVIKYIKEIYVNWKVKVDGYAAVALVRQDAVAELETVD